MNLHAAALIDKSQRITNKKLEDHLAAEYRKILKSRKSATQCIEVNTFIFLSSQASSKVDKEKTIQKIETGIANELHKKYYKPNKSNLQKELERKQELIETSKIVREFIEEIEPKKAKSFNQALKKISHDLPELLFDIQSRSYVTLWDFNEPEEYRLYLPAFDQPVFTTNNLQGLEPQHLIERLAIMNFLQNFLQPTKKLLSNLNNSLEKLKTEIQKPHIRTINQRAQSKFELFIQIIHAKLSALHDVDRTTNRIFNLLQEAEKSIRPLNLTNAEINLNQEINQIQTQMKQSQTLLEQIEQRLQRCKIRDYFDSTKNQIKTSQTQEEFKNELKQMSELSSDLFVEAELLKMWSDFFGADLPYFSYSTSISEAKDDNLNKTADDHLISVRGLIKNYDLGKTTVYALRGVNLDIDKGEFVAIVGNSGAGKTTLLNCMAGLDTPDHGSVIFKGTNLHKMTDKDKSRLRLVEMGFIFQSYALLPHFTAQENVELPAVLAQKNKELTDRIEQLLEGVGISNQAKQFPAQLSGGQMQRVAIARALTNNPTVIFADEPTGDLDSQTGKQVMELLKTFHEETKTTIVLITHEENIANYAQRQIILEDGVVKNHK